MKVKLLFLTALLSVMHTNAQSYMGYVSDNYAGVQGVLFNPASIVDSRFKADINLASFSTTLSNNYYGVSLFDLSSESYDFEDEAVRTPAGSNGGDFSLDVMGPSFMFNIAPKHAIAISTRARMITNVIGVNGNLLDELKGGMDDANNFYLRVDDIKMVENAWAELGVSYAAVLWESKEHFIKGGLTAKYLAGGISTYIETKNLTTDFNQANNSNLTTLKTTGTLATGSSQDVFLGDEEFQFDSDSKGFGADLGFVYEWRPEYRSYDLDNAEEADNSFKGVNKYKLRFGFSVTDIGSIEYANLRRDVYNVGGTVTQQEIEDAEDVQKFLDDHYTAPTKSFKSTRANLPTMTHLDLDCNVYKKFYLNLNGNFNLVDKKVSTNVFYQDMWMLTPRYESKWLTFSLPVNYTEYDGVQVGSGLRFGPLFLGSSSIISNVISKESKGADVYFGIKVPIYQKKAKINKD